MRTTVALRHLLPLALSIPFLSANAQTAAVPKTEALKAPIVGLWLMGQSLCDGSESLPIVTTADTGWGNYSFKRGVRTWLQSDHGAKPELRAQEDFAFVPLIATANGGLGETMANGLADHLKGSLKIFNRTPTRNDAPHFLVAYAGQGGRTIEELAIADESTDLRTIAAKQSGGGYYKTSLDDARRATEQAKAQGKNFAIAALVWMQGEANGGAKGGIVPSRWKDEIPHPAGQEWYRDRLIAYRNQWAADLRGITGQHGDIPMFTYQTLGPAGEAQVLAADADANIYMVGPHYAVPSAINSRTTQGRYGASIHLAADGERWYGEQVAKVVRRVLIENEGWNPLRPRKAWIDPNRTSLLLEYDVPRPPLVIDETFLARQESEIGKGTYSSLNGFRVRDSANGVPAMTKIEVDAPNRLRIHFAAPLPKGIFYKVHYGMPHSEKIGTVTSIRPGPTVNDQATTEVLFKDAGEILRRLKPLIDEGAFYAANNLSGAATAQAVIRHVSQEKDSLVVLRLENRERRNDVDFAPGQTVIAMRPFQYGNIRDSDPEQALYKFADTDYGKRAGQPYPLWNWSILFGDFVVTDE